MSDWPDFFFQPINLWNYPKQNRDFKMNISEETTVRPQWVLKDLKANDTQVDGTHYKDMDIEPWEVMGSILSHEEFVGFLKGNIIKYSMRNGKKEGATKDAEKARHYVKKLEEEQTKW